MSSYEIGDDELDDILDSALEEFEEEELNKVSASIASDLGKSPADVTVKSLDAKVKDDTTMQLNQMIKDLEDPAQAEALRETYEHLSGGKEGSDTFQAFLEHIKEQERLSAAGGAASDDVANAAQKTSFNPGDGATDVDRSVAQTLEMLAENAKDMEGMSSTQVEGFGEDMMNNMMAEFEKLGEKEDFNQVVDGMMRQLLSKELMYEPIKQVCEKYPEWLAVQVDSLDKEEYERYGNQYQFFQRIRAVYETEPDNLARLMELMHDVQQYGQPPAEIIKELAPGLEFNAEGMPVMPGLGETMMPGQEGMPGMPGLPFPETGPDGKPCTVM